MSTNIVSISGLCDVYSKLKDDTIHLWVYKNNKTYYTFLSHKDVSVLDKKKNVAEFYHELIGIFKSYESNSTVIEIYDIYASISITIQTPLIVLSYLGNDVTLIGKVITHRNREFLFTFEDNEIIISTKDKQHRKKMDSKSLPEILKREGSENMLNIFVMFYLAFDRYGMSCIITSGHMISLCGAHDYGDHTDIHFGYGYPTNTTNATLLQIILDTEPVASLEKQLANAKEEIKSLNQKLSDQNKRIEVLEKILSSSLDIY